MLWFLWFKDLFKFDSEVVHLRFTKLVFGLRPSPAMLGAVISHHLSKYKHLDQGFIITSHDSFCVDNLVSGGSNVKQAFKTYCTTKNVMSEGGFNLQKWNSNFQELMRQIQITETLTEKTSLCFVTFSPSDIAKEENCLLVKPFSNNTELLSKLLDIGWDDHSDEFIFDLTELIEHGKQISPSKRSLLKFTVRIFDHLGLLSPFVIHLRILFVLISVTGMILCKEIYSNNGKWLSLNLLP